MEELTSFTYLHISRRLIISEVARVIGLMTASFPGLKYGPLHFRDLERCKSRAVKESKGSYDCTMKLDGLALCDVQWWIDNIDLSDNEIYQDPPITHNDN